MLISAFKEMESGKEKRREIASKLLPICPPTSSDEKETEGPREKGQDNQGSGSSRQKAAL